MRHFALLSILAFAQALPALAFSRHKPSTLCQMIVSSDYSQDQIDKKIDDEGDMKNATCTDDENQKIPIVFYAIAHGISNEDYQMDNDSATVETIERLVQHGAALNDVEGQSSDRTRIDPFIPNRSAFTTPIKIISLRN